MYIHVLRRAVKVRQSALLIAGNEMVNSVAVRNAEKHRTVQYGSARKKRARVNDCSISKHSIAIWMCILLLNHADAKIPTSTTKSSANATPKTYEWRTHCGVSRGGEVGKRKDGFGAHGTRVRLTTGQAFAVNPPSLSVPGCPRKHGGKYGGNGVRK